MASTCVATFLETFVTEDKHDEARADMEDIFAAMSAELAREIFRNFKGVTNSSSFESEDEEKPKKKRAPRKKKDEDEEGVEKSERLICSGLTAAGNQCKNKACENEELCHVHLKKKNEPPKEKKVKEKKPKKVAEPKKAKKGKKQVPEHNHELTEEITEDCALCESHGNKASGFEDFDEEFELDGDAQSTLKAILAKASDSDEEDDDDEEELEENEDMKFLEEMEAELTSPQTRSKTRAEA